nr:hypothetical protein [Angustibacter aerolatus]
MGHQYDCALVFNDVATTWPALVNPWFVQGGDADKRWDQWVRQSPSRRLVIAQSLVPGQAPEDWRARGAAGEYDAQFAALGKTLVAAGLGDATIRLAHEGNGTWFKHDIGDALEHRQWATYWARVAGILHATPGASLPHGPHGERGLPGGAARAVVAGRRRRRRRGRRPARPRGARRADRAAGPLAVPDVAGRRVRGRRRLRPRPRQAGERARVGDHERGELGQRRRRLLRAADAAACSAASTWSTRGSGTRRVRRATSRSTRGRSPPSAPASGRPPPPPPERATPLGAGA